MQVPGPGSRRPVGGDRLAWTSRVSDEEGEGPDRYAKEIYSRFQAMYESNPAVDLLICGDFNDTAGSKSVTEYLHATTGSNDVRPGGPLGLEGV
jgi:hypothetical protein